MLKEKKYHLLKQLLLGLGLRRVDGVKRKWGQRIRLQPEFGEMLCPPLLCHCLEPPGQETLIKNNTP